MLDKRAQILLKTLIERYIAEGQPSLAHAVALCRLDCPGHHPQRHVGPGGDGADRQPHTSAGRVPTPLGYRFFVDSLLVVKQLESGELHQLEDQLHPTTRSA